MMRSHYSSVGLDIDGRWIRAAQLIRGAGRWKLHAAMQLEREDPAAPLTPSDAAAVAGALERQGFVPAPLVLSAPREACIAAVLELPPRSSGAPLRQIARAELSRTVRVDPAAMECELWDVPGIGRATETSPAMVVALPHASGELMAGIFSGVSDVAAIDARMCALARASSTWLPAAGIGAIVDVGWHSSSITVLIGTTPIFDRTLEHASLSHLHASIAKKVGAEAVVPLMQPSAWQDAEFLPLHQQVRPCFTAFLDSMATELSRSLTYIAHRMQQAPLGAVLVSGPEVPGLCERIEKTLGQPVRALTPADAVEIGPSCGHHAQRRELLAAIGLAIPAGSKKKATTGRDAA